MTSPIDISNRALSEIGTRSSITAFDDGSKEATACGLWYDVLRKRLLRAAPWGFARKQAVMSQLGSALTDDCPYPWLYKYTYPADALAVRYILPQTPPLNSSVVGTAVNSYGFLGPSRANRFIIAQDTDNVGNDRKVLLSNIQNAQAVYIKDEENCELFDDTFEGALEAALSAKLVIPLSGNAAMRASFIQSATDAIVAARVSSANEALSTTDHVPDWMAVRGIGDSLTSQWYALGQWNLPFEDINWGM